MFYHSTHMVVGNGRRTLLWMDKWLNGKSIADLAPCLLQAVGPRVQKCRTVQEALINRRWVRDITGALTVQVLLEYLDIREIVRGMVLDPNVDDRVCWIWTTDSQFTTASAYKAFFIGQPAIPCAKILHKTRAPGKYKFFMWLGLHKRCWTAARRKRYGLQDDDACILCDQESETITHLSVKCVFSREIWHRVLQKCGWPHLAPRASEHSLPNWWTEEKL
ncbi:unnamed protein product [Urochloa humidicola]